MLLSYFTIAWRSLCRNARYLIINVLGLGIALGFCILALSLMGSIFKINIGVRWEALAYSALGILSVAALTIAYKLI